MRNNQETVIKLWINLIRAVRVQSFRFGEWQPNDIFQVMLCPHYIKDTLVRGPYNKTSRTVVYGMLLLGDDTSQLLSRSSCIVV